MTVRERIEAAQDAALSPLACRAAESRGREVPEPECSVRTCFQRDIDRIVHSKSFRRLKHKTQVFLQPEGDHYRTRMTHTIEVVRIARTIARGLFLNEDLTEAVAFGHDLGHTPFGHAGERVLDEIMPGGFRHYEQSLRVVDALEKNGAGLNLTWEVRNGILCHTKGEEAATLEGRIVRLADRIAYINHDIDDAIRAGIIKERDIPKDVSRVLGPDHRSRINTLTEDVIAESEGLTELHQSEKIGAAMEKLHDFMFERVYLNPVAKAEETKAQGMIRQLFVHYVNHMEDLPADAVSQLARDGKERVVCDYIAGMTDQFAVDCYKRAFLPLAWSVK